MPSNSNAPSCRRCVLLSLAANHILCWKLNCLFSNPDEMYAYGDVSHDNNIELNHVKSLTPELKCKTSPAP